MPVTISIPAPLRQFASGQSQLTVEAKTAGEALDQLTSTHSALRRHLFNDQNVLRNFVNVYLNDEDIRHAAGPDTPVKDGDTRMIVPSIAGGAVIESEVVEESNLQRQIIHGTKDLGRRKIESARDRLRDINPHIEIETHEARLTSENALRLFRNYAIIVDGTDNFPTRYLVNDACVLTGKPNVYGSIFRFEGQASVFWAEKGACYRCLYPEPPPPGLVPSCAEGGVLGVLPGIVGAIQANETIKIILGADDLLINRLLLFDAWPMKFREFKLRKDPKCPVCGENATIKDLIDYEEFCGMAAHQLPPADSKLEEISATELNARRLRGDKIQIVDVREPHEFEIARIPGTKLIPLGHLVTRMNEIDPEIDTIVHCKGGVRSAKAIEALKRAGFQGRLINLKGGITAWSEDVDPRVAKY